MNEKCYSTYNPIVERVCLVCGYPKYNDTCPICELTTNEETNKEILDSIFSICWNQRMGYIGDKYAISEILHILNGVHV